jgi:ERF superfamily
MTIETLPTVAAPAATLVSAIASMMAEVHTVAKRGVNQFHKYAYARMEDILAEITPLLGRPGLVIFQSETGRAMFDDDNVIAVEYAFTVAHVSGETWPHQLRQTGVSFCRASNGRWDDKSLAKCHTAARKYFLLALFQIPTGEEADADLGENDERPAKQIARSKPEYVVPPPSRRLREGIADRAMVARAARAWEPKPPKIFRASEAGKFDERNPPPHDVVPDRAQEAAKALNRRLYPINDELPAHSAPPRNDGIPPRHHRQAGHPAGGRPARRDGQAPMRNVWLIIAADFVALAVVGAVILLASAAFQALWQ